MSLNLGKKKNMCYYSLNCVPSGSYVEALIPNTSEYDYIWESFKDVIKLEWGYWDDSLI